MNKWIGIGNLTKDPELSTTTNGNQTVRFSMAVQRKFKNADGQYETDFINCVAWKTTAEFISKYFKKGNKIAVVGSIQTRSYDDKDGIKKHVTEVLVSEVEFTQSRTQSEAGSTEAVGNEKLQPVDDDDLPF